MKMDLNRITPSPREVDLDIDNAALRKHVAELETKVATNERDKAQDLAKIKQTLSHYAETIRRIPEFDQYGRCYACARLQGQGHGHGCAWYLVHNPDYVEK